MEELNIVLGHFTNEFFSSGRFKSAVVKFALITYMPPHCLTVTEE